MIQVKLPQIPRKIAAPIVWYTEKIGLWSFITALFLINLYAKANLTPSYWEKLIRTTQSPSVLTNHLDLAQAFWQEGMINQAETELAVVQTLQGKAAVLGMTTDPATLMSEWRRQPNKLTQSYRFWKATLKEHPDYRDAYLALAAISYQRSNFSEASIYLNEALNLDPNFSPAQKLKLALDVPSH